MLRAVAIATFDWRELISKSRQGKGASRRWTTVKTLKIPAESKYLDQLFKILSSLHKSTSGEIRKLKLSRRPGAASNKQCVLIRSFSYSGFGI